MNTLYKSIFLCIILTLSFSVFAQPEYNTKSKKAIKYFEEAMNKFNLRMDQEAIDLLDVAIKADDQFIDAYMLKAEVYYQQGRSDQEIMMYEKIIQINPQFSAKVYAMAGDALLKSGKYAESIEFYKRCQGFEKLSPNYRLMIEASMKKAEFGLDKINNPVPFEPVNLGGNVNSVLNEYWPSLTADEQTLIITVLVPRPGVDPATPVSERSFHEDLYVSHLENGKWTKAYNIGPEINTFQYNEGTQAFSVDGQHLFYTVCNKPGDYGRCDIYYCRKISGKWTLPENIGPPVSTGAWESHPSFSSNGRTLYFTSNRKGGVGEMDIWTTDLQDDGTWSEPVNLGDSINTPGFEMSPYIHPDNQTLYFASDGHLGMGDMDIFFSKRKSDGWGTPENIGYPINTHKKEKGLIVNATGNLAYFSSDRNEATREDIYSFDLYPEARPTLVTYVKGRVYDADTKKGIDAEFQLTDLSTHELVVESTSEAVSGKYLVVLPSERNYAFNIFKKGYMFHSETFTLKTMEDPDEAYYMDFALKPLKENETVILKNIFFETDMYELKPESVVELNKLVQFLTDNPGLHIEIGGHTDNIGSLEHNKALSHNRANSVYTYLLEHGIHEKRLSFKGYDYSIPIATNDTEKGRAKNRRTEFKVVKIEKKE